MMHLYIMFRVDGRKTMYRNDITITSVGIKFVKEMLKIVLRDIGKYLEKSK